MEKLLKTSIVKGFLFSVYEKLGPQPKYMVPTPNKTKKANNKIKPDDESFSLDLRDYTQISIKNLSLLIGDGKILETVDVDQFQYFGIIPFPDFRLTSLTFFHFIDVSFSNEPLATAFSLFIDEDKRSFLYNNINRLKNIILDLFQELDTQFKDEFKPQDELYSSFFDFLKNVIRIEKTPLTPFTTQRKMKIIFAGLDDSGKTSFLLSVDNKFSKLMALKPTIGAQVSSIEALGSTIFLWDLGGQLSLRRKYLTRAQIYLYEADLLFYFIDIRNQKRFDESIDYLRSINLQLKKFKQNTPIVYILSKGDPDIINSELIKNNISIIRKKLNQVDKNPDPDIFLTSIFETFSILRAFSTGISKLSPNREIIAHNLRNFLNDTNTYLALILSDDGLVLAENFTPKATELTDISDAEDLMSVFEILAPNFALLYKIFSKYKKIKLNEALFKVADSTILFKKVNIYRYEMYILFLLDEENKKNEITSKLPNFLNLTQDLLLRYIA